MTKKKWWLSTIGIIIIVIVLLGLSYLMRPKIVPREFIASGHPAWAPIMYQDDNLIVGAGPEIVAKIFNELGIKISFLYEGPWDFVQEKARSGEVDVLVAAYKTTERETYMDYSVPYTIDPVSLFVKKGKAFTFAKWDDLIGKKGLVTTGDSYGQEFDQFIKDKLRVTTVATPDEAFSRLLKGEADYFVYALYSGENALAANKNLKEQIEILPSYVSSENFYMTISKKSPLVKYLPQINQLLEKYKADGTISQTIANIKNAQK